jgi:hypothetical protein
MRMSREGVQCPRRDEEKERVRAEDDYLGVKLNHGQPFRTRPAR